MKIRAPKGTWDFIILVWSAYVVFAIAFELVHKADGTTAMYLHIGDTIACAFFFTDVMWRWAASPNKIKFWKWGWIDLLASIPTIDGLRWARLFRVFRIFRVVRGLRSATRVASYFFGDKVQATVVLALTILFGSILVSGLLVLDFEKGVGNIKTPFDALWWSITTITTVGYGDTYPVTDGGRLVGMGLMFVGISLFGTVSALLASWLLKSAKTISESNAEVKALKEKLASIEGLLVKIHQNSNKHDENKPHDDSRID